MEAKWRQYRHELLQIPNWRDLSPVFGQDFFQPFPQPQEF